MSDNFWEFCDNIDLGNLALSGESHPDCFQHFVKPVSFTVGGQGYVNRNMIISQYKQGLFSGGGAGVFEDAALVRIEGETAASSGPQTVCSVARF